MGLTWQRFLKPLPEPHTHFQRTHEWADLVWTNKQAHLKKWTEADGLINCSLDLPVQVCKDQLIENGFELVGAGSYPIGRRRMSDFREDLKRDLKTDFEWYKANLGEENLSGFAILTDSSAATLSTIANTFADIDNRSKYLSEEEARFMACEWQHDIRHLKTFDFVKIMIQKRDLSVPFDPQPDFNSFKRDFFRTCVSVMAELRSEKVFPQRKDFVLLVEVADDDQIPGMFKRLNPNTSNWRFAAVYGPSSTVEHLVYWTRSLSKRFRVMRGRIKSGRKLF